MFSTFVFLSLLFSSVVSGRCHLILQPESVVPTGDIHLSALGSLDCMNPHEQKTLQKQLRTTLIARIFPSSPRLILRKKQLIARYEQLYRQTDLVFQGPETIIVTIGRSSQNRTSLRLDLEATILENLPDSSNRRIEWIKFPETLATKNPKETLKVDTDRLHAGFARVQTMLDGRVLRQYYIRFRVEKKAVALVATQSLDRGSNLSPNHFTIEERWVDEDIQPVSAAALAGPGQLMIARDIQKGETIVQRDITRPPLIRKNQSIRAIFQKGSLKLEIEVQAMSDGRLGDRIKVLSPQTRRQYTAKILSETQVEIIL